MTEDKRIHSGVPYGNRPQVTPIVAAEAGGRTGAVFAPPYEETRVTPSDHTVEEDTYNWAGSGVMTASTPLHFDDAAGKVITWAWRGLICLALMIPVSIVSGWLTFFLMTGTQYSWAVWPLVLPPTALVTLGLAGSLTSLIHFGKSNQPMLTVSLSLLGIAIGTIMLLYLASSLGHWQLNIATHTCDAVLWYNCNPK